MMTPPRAPSGLRRQKRNTEPTEPGNRHARGAAAPETVIVWAESAIVQYRMRGSRTAYSRSTPRLTTTMVVTTTRLMP